jgi:hypothetical protein
MILGTVRLPQVKDTTLWNDWIKKIELQN